MKSYKILISTVIPFLLVSWIAFGQEQERPRQRGVNRQTIQNMTVEQKRLYQAQMRQRRGSSNFRTDQGEQLKAIEAIQEQLVKYKTALQNVNREALLNYENISEEERTKLIQNMTKAAQARQSSLTTIENKLTVIRGERRQNTETVISVPIRELESIHQIALKEKATQAARRLERLITQYKRRTGRVPQIPAGSETLARP